MFKRKLPLPAAVVALIALLQTWFGWNLATQFFFRQGAYFMDAGIFSYSLASSAAPMNSPRLAPYLGANFQAVHLFLSPLGFMKLTGLVFTVPAINLCVFLALQQGLAAAFGGLLLWRLIAPMHLKRTWQLAAISSGAVALPLANMVLGSLLYPHPEPFGAALAGAGLLILFSPLARAKAWKIFGWVALSIGALGREDMGMHIAIVCVALWILAPTAMRDFTRGKPALRWLGVGALAVTLASNAYQRLIDPAHPSRFSDVFSGTPPYAHLLDLAALHQRFANFYHQRLDLILIFGLLGILGFVLRNRLLLAYPLASAFWLLLNFTAVDPAKAVLGTYNQFALVTYLAVVPMLSYVLKVQGASVRFGAQTQRRAQGAKLAVWTVLASVLALGVTGVMPSPVGGGYFWRWIFSEKPISMSQMQLDASRITKLQASTKHLIVDDGVFAIEPVITRRDVMAEDKRGAVNMNALVFLPQYELGKANVARLFGAAVKRGERIQVSCLAPNIAVAHFVPLTSRGYRQGELAQKVADGCNK